MLEYLPFTVSALATAYQEGASPVDVVDEFYRRLSLVDDPAIFIHLVDQKELRQAAENLGDYDPESSLWGIPFAVKDNIDVAGITTTAGCPAYAYMPERDSFVVERLKGAGALMVGKTNLDQFATGLVGVRTPYGIPLNAVDACLVPGGSSGGSGVIVGHGIVSFSLGTDTAGSGRVPAALNNIVGLKPSLGSLSATGVVPACRTLDTISVFAMTVDDAFSVFKVACEYDESDAYAKRFSEQSLISVGEGLRIGIPDSATAEFFDDTAQEMAFRRDVALLEEIGHEIVELDFSPFYDVARMLYEGAWVAERYTVIAGLLAENPDAVHPVTRDIIRSAENMSAADAFTGIYKLQELKRVAESVMDDLDLLCVPTIPTFYTLADLEADPVVPNSNLGTYTNFVNLLDMCGIAVPTAPRTDSKPGSVTLLGASGCDGLVASVARGFEKNCDRHLAATLHRLPPPADLYPVVPNSDIQLAVCGAHMSLLPLNNELTDRGGKFVRAARSVNSYRLIVLAEGSPKRPGLIRVVEEVETGIELEIWSVPQVEVGNFLASIPAPLGLGSIELEDGVWVKGFVCDASGAIGAEDITHLGGWRKYLETGSGESR